MSSARSRRLAGVFAAGAVAATGLALLPGTASADRVGPTMDIQLLSFNDFHGNLEPPSGSGGRLVTGRFIDTADTDKDGNTTEIIDTTVNAGGAEYLAGHLKDLRQGHPYSLTVTAGDIVGASPLLSAAFHDEPTIESMNAMGLDVAGVGNHEFDEGYQELQRLAEGGCLDDGAGAANQDSCPGGKTFGGADFDVLAANVKYAGTQDTILPPYSIENIKGAKVAFIGMTLEGTPNIVTQSGIAGLEFTDEVETANALVPVLREQGVNAIVVLLHEGGLPTAREPWVGPDGKTYQVNAAWDYTCNRGGSISGPIVAIAKNLDPAIDMVVSGHTHAPYVCNIPDPAGQGRMVTSASSFGRLITETTLTYDRRIEDIVRTSTEDAQNLVVTRQAAYKDAEQTTLIDGYRTLIAPIADRHLGTISQDVLHPFYTPGVTPPAGINAGGETQLGDLIADAQLADPSVITDGKTPQIAFMNPGGIRTSLSYPSSPKGEGDGVVTFEEAFTVQPFNNYLVSMDLTGAQIKELLLEQWGAGAKPGQPNTPSAPKILQVSEGFAYTYSGTALTSVTLDGEPLVDGQTYRIVTNNFLSDGGDGFPVFRDGAAKYFGGLDIDAFANYLEDNSPYTPGALDRITRQ